MHACKHKCLHPRMMHVCVCGEEGYSRVYLKRLSDLLSLLQKVHREGQVSLFQSAIACAGNLYGLFDVKKEIIIFFNHVFISKG